MKLSRFGLMAGAGLAVVTASAADATVYIAYSYGGGPVTLAAWDPTDATWSATIAPNLKVTTTSGSAGTLPSVLDSNVSVRYTAGAGPAPLPLDIFVTVDNLASIVGKFDSGLTENQLIGNWSITESTFVSASNALYGGTLLASNAFNGPSTLTATFDALSGNFSLAGPYSVTHQYHIIAPTSGPTSLALSTISVTATAVPEPATWVLMLGGFGLAGLSLRGRSVKVRAGYAA
jgi:hypothetical protein